MCTKMSADRDNFLLFPKQMHLLCVILLPYFPGSAEFECYLCDIFKKREFLFQYYEEYYLKISLRCSNKTPSSIILVYI